MDIPAQNQTSPSPSSSINQITKIGSFKTIITTCIVTTLIILPLALLISKNLPTNSPEKSSAPTPSPSMTKTIVVKSIFTSMNATIQAKISSISGDTIFVKSTSSDDTNDQFHLAKNASFSNPKLKILDKSNAAELLPLNKELLFTLSLINNEFQIINIQPSPANFLQTSTPSAITN